METIIIRDHRFIGQIRAIERFKRWSNETIGIPRTFTEMSASRIRSNIGSTISVVFFLDREIRARACVCVFPVGIFVVRR